MCARVNVLTPEFFGTEADSDLRVVHAAELSDFLMVSRESVLRFLGTFIAATNVEADAEALANQAFAVRCTELCNKTVQRLPEAHRPPSSDVACYVPAGSLQPVCDIDVSHSALRGLRFDDHNPEVAQSKFSESPSRQALNATGPGGGAQRHPNITAQLRALRELNYPEKTMHHLSIAVANLFRVYPLASVGVVDLRHEFPEHTESAVEVESVVAAGHHWDYDYPSYDSSTRRRAYELSSPRRRSGAYSYDRRREATYPEGRRRSSSGGGGGDGLGPAPAAPSPGGAGSSGPWKDQVQRVSAKAQAYAAGALRNLNTGAAKGAMQKWFGTTDVTSQQEMRRVVNGVHGLLTNVDYVYPGSKCRPNVFAYVFPDPPNNKNDRGQFIFHLCDLYMKSGLQEQIETLTHEGSHHQTMSTDDVCYSGSGDTCKRAYGRTTCASLAQASPRMALKNADNFCFFINDAYEGGGGSADGPDGSGGAGPVPAASGGIPSPGMPAGPLPSPGMPAGPVIPDWLKPYMPSPSPSAPSPAIPDWLKPYLPSQSLAAPSPGIPDWLKPYLPSTSSAGPSPGSQSPGFWVPPWLQSGSSGASPSPGVYKPPWWR